VVSYRAEEEGCTTYRWTKEELHNYLTKNREGLEVAADRVQMSDLKNKLQSAQETHIIALYESLLKTAVCDNFISKEERNLCETYRQLHSKVIDEKVHSCGLAKLGWTEAEYQKGTKRRRKRDMLFMMPVA